MSSSFLKKRNNVVFIVDPANNMCAVFLYPYRGWYKDNFKASMKSAYVGTFPKDEISQMPIWWAKAGAAVVGMEIHVVSGYRFVTNPDFTVAFAASSWDSQGEVISKGNFPLRLITAGTYALRVLFDGANTVDSDISSVVADGLGDISNIVRYLNNLSGFALYGEAFVVGTGDAAQLGIRSKATGSSSSVEILTTVTDDCSVLLGFTPEKENMIDKGDAATLVGTFDQYSNAKTG